LTDIERPVRDFQFELHVDAEVDELTPDEKQGLNIESVSPARMAVRRFVHHRVAMISLVLFGFIALVIIFAPITARYSEIYRLPPVEKTDPTTGAVTLKSSYNSPYSEAWFGTDDLNRDLYSRVIWGGRVSLFIGLAVALSASVIGTIIGALAGFRGGLIDDLLMRTTDLFLAFPLLVTLLVLRNAFNEIAALSYLFGELSSIRFIVMLLSFVGWMGVARIVRGVVLSLKEREFVEAAKAVGASNRRIIIRHLIPNSIGPILVAMTTAVVAAIIAESALSFFGYGVNPGEGKASWGNLLAASKGAVNSGFWWIPLFPGAVFVITILCINFIGDGLRDAFDPKQDKGQA
jgi:peptide/nickel transport system permease protein